MNQDRLGWPDVWLDAAVESSICAGNEQHEKKNPNMKKVSAKCNEIYFSPDETGKFNIISSSLCMAHGEINHCTRHTAHTKWEWDETSE